MDGHARFDHPVGVNFEFLKMTPFKGFEVIGLKPHFEHVVICESKVYDCVCGIFHIFPRYFIFNKILWEETLVSESGKGSAYLLGEFAFSKEVSGSGPKGGVFCHGASSIYNIIKGEG